MNKTWNEIRNELFTPEEIAKSDSRVALMGELIKARKEYRISQPDHSRRLKHRKLHKS